MAEMDFARYAGQLRAWTHRDAMTLAEVEQELIEELDRVQARECGCYYCREMKGKPWPSSAPVANAP